MLTNVWCWMLPHGAARWAHRVFGVALSCVISPVPQAQRPGMLHVTCRPTSKP